MLVTVKAEMPKSLDKRTKGKIEDLSKDFDTRSYAKYNSFLSKMKD